MVEWCIFPEPPRVNLKRSDVIAHLRKQLTDVSALGAKDAEGNPVTLFQPDELNRLVIREYLRRSDRFKEDICPPADHQIWRRSFVPRPIELITRYWCMQMPKYIWVVELANRADLSGRAPLDRKIIGEVLFDSTGHHLDPVASLLAFHLDDRLIIRRPPPESDRFEEVKLQRHEPYSPLLRLN
jgi:hypothetical protein